MLIIQRGNAMFCFVLQNFVSLSLLFPCTVSLSSQTCFWVPADLTLISLVVCESPLCHLRHSTEGVKGSPNK
uniref:Secreted protein n=1 Tax=Anguilla anguilla TaxID=7936 RepID=A0A0E9Q0E6_ANGAN